jgi:hypothetical protein
MEPVMNRALMEYTPETEAFEQEALELGETEWSGEAIAEAVFGETDEMELAAGLLEVTSESELDRFLGNLIGRAGQALGTFVRTPTGQALGGILKGAAKQALPVIGRGLGGYLGGASGAERGAQFAQAAGKLFGLELEGLSPEDQEFEAAKSFVRFAGEAVKNAAAAPASSPPQTVAQAAAVQAARRYAPGLFQNVPRPQSASPSRKLVPGQTGSWVRRGRNIIIVNC